MGKFDWKEFHERLVRRVQAHGCNHDHIHTRAVLTCMGCDRREIMDTVGMLREYGGFCDCEVLLNAGLGREPVA